MIKMKYKKPSVNDAVDTLVMMLGLYLVYSGTGNGWLTFGVFLVAISSKFSLGSFDLSINTEKKYDERS